MVFAGSGSGILGLFTIAVMVKDKPLKELALPWEAIYYLEYFEEDRWFEKERLVNLQLHIDLICSVENYQEVRTCIEPYLRDDIYIIKDLLSEWESPPFLKIEDKIEKEIEFLLCGFPD